MTIPVVFWLVLIAEGSYTHGQATVMPVPFATIDDCYAAGKTVNDQDRYVIWSCPMQRQTDVSAYAMTFNGSFYRDRGLFK